MVGARRKTGQHVRCGQSPGAIPREAVPGLSLCARPHPRPRATVAITCGADRSAWNWGLDRCRERYEAERKWYSGIDLHRLWNEEEKRNPELAWWKENSKRVYQEAFRNLDRALGDFIAAKRGERKGRPLGFPRLKRKGRCRDPFASAPG
jgi:putative transposase